MTKITDVVCKDGKRHHWKYIISEELEPTVIRRFVWCKKCGSLTEFVRNRFNKGKKWLRCIEDDEEYYIEIPKL